MLDLTQLAAAVRYEGGLSRRLFLAYSTALAALPALATRAAGADRAVTFASNPFALGVASGDPDSTSVLLWTRLAPKPLEPGGGMKAEPVNVTWEVADDESMKRIVASGQAVAAPQLAHTVHVEAAGLKPDHWYFYRFRTGDSVSPAGRTRTLPDATATPKQIKFAFASCQSYEAGLYLAYSQMARDNPDLVFFLGDYIYEFPRRENAFRKHSGPPDRKVRSVAEYRERYSQYRLDPLLQGIHAACPWFVTWDDHEVENNYAGSTGEGKEDPAAFLNRRAAAYQAYYEMMPLRPRSLPRGPDMLLYRQASFGRLAQFFVLDTRQYRSNQPNGGGRKPLNEAALAATNSLLGKRQRQWLNAGLTASTGTWNVLAQQVMFALIGYDTGAHTGYSMDQWPGAAAERIDLMKFIADRKVSNPVVLSGDIHSNWVNELRVDDRRPGQPVVGAEFVGTSVTSSGNEPPEVPGLEKIKSLNPGVKFHNRARGYVRCTVTPTLWKSDYVRVENITNPASRIYTQAAYVIEAGRAGIKKA